MSGSLCIADETLDEPEMSQEPITRIPRPPAVDPARRALGERLFQDRRLSHENSRACMSCHDVNTNGATANQHDLTPDGTYQIFNTSTIFNASLSFRFSWEGRYRTMEEQVLQVVVDPDVMATSVPEILSKLLADGDVVRQFEQAYGRVPDETALLDAIVTYERTLLTPDSRFDRWLSGDNTALSEMELAGYQLFKSLGCVSCHQGVNVGGNMFQRHGICSPLASPNLVTVRVPSLRNVAVTAPYFHDGSAPTLTAAVQAMANAQLGRSLPGEQTDNIIAFLTTLTGRYHGRPVVAP